MAAEPGRVGTTSRQRSFTTWLWTMISLTTFTAHNRIAAASLFLAAAMTALLLSATGIRLALARAATSRRILLIPTLFMAAGPMESCSVMIAALGRLRSSRQTLFAISARLTLNIGLHGRLRSSFLRKIRTHFILDRSRSEERRVGK